MANEIFVLQGNIDLDINKVSSDLDKVDKKVKSTSSKIADFGKSCSSIGANLTTKVTLPLVGLAGASVNFASDLDESLNKVQVAFKGNSSEVEQFTSTTLKSFGISKGSALEMASLFGDMATGMGLNTSKASEMAQSLVGLAGDLSSFKNVKLEVAQTALNGIFTGETESLKGLGIVMTQANLNEYALQQGMSKTIDKMSQAEQVQLRYAYVMGKTKNAQGDFANTSDGTANSMRIFTESLKELAATLGEYLLPIITPFIQKMTDLVQQFSQMSPEQQKFILGLAGFLAIAPPIILFVGKIVTAITTLYGAFVAFKKLSWVTTGITKLKGALTALGGVIMAHPIIAVGTVIIGILVLLYNKCEWFRDGVHTVIDAVVNFFNVTIPAKFEEFKQYMIGLWNAVKLIFADALQAIIDFFTIKIPEFIQSIVDWFLSLPYKIGYALGLAWLKVQEWANDLWTWVTVDLPAIIEGIIDWFKQLPDRIWTCLCLAWERVKQWGSDTYNSATQWISDTIDSVVDWFKGLPNRIWIWLCNTVDSIKQWGRDMYNSASQWVGDTVDGIVDWFSELPDKMLDIGKNIIHGLWDGITGAKDWLWGKITGFADGIVDGFKDALGIHSPSRVLRDEVGKFMSQGIGVGFEDELANTNLEIARSLNTTVDVAKGEANTNSTTSGSNANYNANNSTSSDSKIITSLLQALLAKDNNTYLDGRELTQGIAPYADEIDKYRNSRNPRLSY